MQLRWRRRRGPAWARLPAGGGERWVNARYRGTAIDVRPGPDRARPPAFAALIQDASLRHERLDLPPMASRFIEKAVREHCLTAQSGDDAIEFSYAASSEAPSDILVVWAQRGAVQQTLETLGGQAPRVTRLLSPGAALAGLLQTAARKTLRSDTSVLVHVGEAVVSVVSYDGRRVVLGREFPRPEEAEPLNSQPLDISPNEMRDANPLVEEIGRSILLFNHRLRGQRAARIVLSSDGFDLEDLQAACAARFGLPVSLLADEVELDLSAFGETPAERTAWILPIAAAVTELIGSPDINLLPARIVTAQRQRGLHAALIAATGIALIVMAGQHGLYLLSSAALARSVGLHSALIEGCDAAVEELAGLSRAREIAAEQAEFLAARMAPAAVARDLLASLSRAATDHLQLERLEITPDDNNPARQRLSLQGVVLGDNPAAAQAEFRLFHDRFLAESELDSVMLGPVRIEPGETGGSVLLFQMTAPATAGEESA